MSVHWGGKGPGHVSRWPRGVGAISPYSGATMLLDFLNPVLDPRITFSRGTNATLIDSTGKLTYAPNNILAWSQTFEDASWAKLGAGTGSAPVVTPNVAVAPDGTQTADLIFFNRGAGTSGSDISYISANPTSFVGNGISSIWLKTSDNSTKVMQLRCGFPVATQITVTGTWQRFAVNSVNTTIDRLQLLLYGTDPNQTASLHVWGAQLEAVTYQTTPGAYNATTAAAYYGPRFDYDPVTLAPRGLLIEEARTNLLTYSDDWSNAAWVKQQVTISANATLSPDGTANADKIAEDNTTAFHRAYQTINKAASAITYVYTVYVKAAERTTASVFIQDSGVFAQTDINLVTGALSNIVGTVSATNAGNGWWRVSVSGTSGAFATALCMVASNNGGSFLGTNGSGIFVWGAQAEAASFATSYIPTVASTVTRNADVATMTGTNFSSWYNQSEGTFVSNGSTLTAINTAVPALLAVSDGTNPNYSAIFADNSSGRPQFVGFVGSVLQFDLSNAPFTITPNVPFSAAGGYKLNDFGMSTNGSAVATDASGTMPTVNILGIGSRHGNSRFLNGHIRTIAYFNTRLPNAQLQTLTAPSLATTLSLDFTSGSYNVGF